MKIIKTLALAILLYAGELSASTNLFAISGEPVYIGPTDAMTTNFTLLNQRAEYVNGFILVTGTNTPNRERCDALFHIDIMTTALENPSICQFQGIKKGNPFTLQASHDGKGSAKITLQQTSASWKYTLKTYGEHIPQLSVSTNSSNPFTYSTSFKVINSETNYPIPRK